MGLLPKCNGCAGAECAVCKFRRLQHRWKLRLQEQQQQQQLLLGAKLPSAGGESSAGCWLSHKISKRGWGVGCKICAAKGLKSSFARFAIRSTKYLQFGILQRHAETAEHRRALGLKVVAAAGSRHKDVFQKVLFARRERQSLRGMNRSLKMSLPRLKMLEFVLAESARKYQRAKLRQARTIVLHQDARGKRLLTRFVAATAKLEVFRGTLPLSRKHRGSAGGLCAATEESLKAWCTPYHGVPTDCRRLSNWKCSCQEAALVEPSHWLSVSICG